MKTRVMEQNRCYHLVSCPAHRAFFFMDDRENDCAGTLRKAGGIRGRVHFSRRHMTSLMEKDIVKRANPDNQMLPI